MPPLSISPVTGEPIGRAPAPAPAVPAPPAASVAVSAPELVEDAPPLRQRLRAALDRCADAGLSIREVAPKVRVIRQGVTPVYLYAVRRGAHPAPVELVEAVERLAATLEKPR